MIDKLKTGSMIVSTLWFTYLFSRVMMNPDGNFVEFLIIMFVLSYFVGELFEKVEQTYLKGQYVASGKWEK